MGKKPAAKVKAKAKGYEKEEAPAAPAAPAEDEAEKEARRKIFMKRLEAIRWSKGKLAGLQLQIKAADDGECGWLGDMHTFHENMLYKVIRRMEQEKSLDDIPEDARAKLDQYLAQAAGKGVNVDKDSFQAMKEIWDFESASEDNYKRPEASPEAQEAAEKVGKWSDASTKGIGELLASMKALAAAPLVQERGLISLGGLYYESQKEGAEGDFSGLVTTVIIPYVLEVMKTHQRDTLVLKGAYAVIRGVASAADQITALCDSGIATVAVAALQANYKDTDLCGTANAAFLPWARGVGKNSPELKILRDAEMPEILMKIMTYHAYEVALTGKVRLTLPFLTED